MNIIFLKLKNTGLVILISTAIYIVYHVVIASFVIVKIARHVECQQEYILRPEVYQPVARTLARYSQSDPKLFPNSLSNYSLTHIWLPEELHRTTAIISEFNASGSYIKIGSGFHHYGLDLELDTQASNSARNIWNLSFYDEFDGTRLLETFSLPANETISEAELSAGLLTNERNSNRDYICQYFSLDIRSISSVYLSRSSRSERYFSIRHSAISRNPTSIELHQKVDRKISIVPIWQHETQSS